ncbi:zinc finger, CCHC-type containing protein [Tanacetum coccineum]
MAKKMHFLLSNKSVVYVLTTPMPEDGGDNPTVEQFRKRAKWDNDDYIYKGLILNCMSNSLFDIYQNVETSKELYDTLEAKYMAEDASSKKFLVSNFTNYKMTNSRLVLEQNNELLDFTHTLKHLKEELTLVEFGSHLRIEESLRVQDNDKPEGNKVASPSVVNMVEHNNSSRYNDNKGKCKHHDTKADPNKKLKVTSWKCGKLGHLKKDCKDGNIGNKANESGIKGLVDGSSNSLKGQNMFNKSLQVYYVTYVSEAYFMQDDDVVWWVNLGETVHDEALYKFKVFKTEDELQQGPLIKRFRTDRGGEYMDTLYFQTESMVLGAVVSFPDQKMKTLGERGIEYIFVRYTKHSKAFRFLLVPKPSQRSLEKGTEDSGGLVVPEKVTEEFNYSSDCCEDSFLEWSLYGLKRVPKQWHQNFDEVVLSKGYLLNQADKCVYSQFDKSAPISIQDGSVATLAKAYSQMYNGKSRHLGVRHSMIRELITNGVVSIEFVRSQQNLADHLTKGLARDLVINYAKGMGLKSMYARTPNSLLRKLGS